MQVFFLRRAGNVRGVFFGLVLAARTGPGVAQDMVMPDRATPHAVSAVSAAAPPAWLAAPPPSTPGPWRRGPLRVTLSAVLIQGLPPALADDLSQALDVAGISFDSQGLRELAERVRLRLLALGYPQARVTLPAQDLQDGVLRLLAQATPGMGLDPPLGQVRGELAADNHGSAHSGRDRLRGWWEWSGLAAAKDQLRLQGVASRQGTWQGAASYSRPWGREGARGWLALARSSYQLGGEFALLDVHGVADTLSAGVSWPVLPGTTDPLELGVLAQHRRLRDQMDAIGVDERKRSDALGLSLSAARTGAGLSAWGQVTAQLGHLHLGPAAREADALSARTEGGFLKATFDASALRALPAQWSLMARAAGQWADKNLDSSEKFTLGGPQGVRAWPLGDSPGDTGWLLQLELRAPTWQGIEPYAFADAGQVRINRLPYLAGPNRRRIDGAGLGLRVRRARWSLDLAVARRGTPPEPASADPGRTQAWVDLTWHW